MELRYYKIAEQINHLLINIHMFTTYSSDDIVLEYDFRNSQPRYQVYRPPDLTKLLHVV